MLEEIRASVQRKNYNILEEIDLAVTLDSHHEKTFNSVISILEAFITAINQHPKINSYLQDLQITSQDLIQSYQRIITSFKELNIRCRKNKVAYHTMKTVWPYFQAFLKSHILQQLDIKGKTAWLLEVETKIACFAILMPDIKNVQDITNCPKEKFAQVWQKITIVPPKDRKSIEKDTKKTQQMLHITASSVINEQSHNNYLAKKMSFGLSFSKYILMNNSAKLRSFKFYRTPTIEIGQHFWNIAEEGAAKEFVKIVYKGIKTNKKIYLPPNGEINNRTDIFTQNPQYIRVRILYSKKLHIFSQGQTGLCYSSIKEEPEFIDTVLIHIHGGGFIAMSSRSMQTYTRQWANQLHIPIISIDYRMPPNHPFPHAPQDCFTVYKFLLDHIHKFMNIKPKKFYIAGDSAGANLTCALTGLILKHKLPIPRGLYVVYPGVDLRLTFTKSRVYSLKDVLLWPTMLLLCLNSYLNYDMSQAENPLASPILLTEEYVNGIEGDKRFPLNWPKTIVTVGTQDPLFDDSLMLMQKLVESKIECECIMYEGLGHGYLNTRMLIKETQRTIFDSIEHLKKLIGIENIKQ